MIHILAARIWLTCSSSWFLQELDSAGSLHAARAAHMRFLEAAAQPCMASSEGSWNVIYSVLRKLLDTCLRFHDLAPVVQVIIMVC